MAEIGVPCIKRVAFYPFQWQDLPIQEDFIGIIHLRSVCGTFRMTQSQANAITSFYWREIFPAEFAWLDGLLAFPVGLNPERRAVLRGQRQSIRPQNHLHADAGGVDPGRGYVGER